ncbi:MAG: murein biosynthesis integral membrane protein MurJ [Anaerolineae bacterium]|nr:murein biosynthesis integral membrane protein MurJ [Anaerolineae bacterium]
MKKTVAKSSLIIAFFFGIDKILSFIRQLFVAREFELSYQLDVFNAANNIPDLLSALISGGALAVAIIPVLTDYLENRNQKEAWRLFSNILNLAFLATAVFSLILVLFTPVLITKVIVPGFPGEQQELAIELMRLDLVAIIIFSISGLFMAGLQANRHFLFPALAPGMYNIGQIFGVAILAPSTGYKILGITLPAFGLGIHGLVYGVIIGASLHLLIQVPGLIMHKFFWEPRLRINAPGVRQVLHLLGPRVLTVFFIQMFFIIRDNLASGMGEGAVTALNLGWFIMQVPESLIGTALGIAILPTISAAISQNRETDYINGINAAIRALLSLTVPITILLGIGLFPLAEFAFSYSPEDTQRVVLASQIYLVGMVGHVLLEIASRAYYAKQQPIIPLVAAGLNAAGYLLISQLLVKFFGFPGIAWANTIVFTVQSVLLLIILNKHHEGILSVGSMFVRVLILSAVVGAGFYFYLHFAPISSALIRSITGMGFGMILVISLMWKEIKPILQVN